MCCFCIRFVTFLQFKYSISYVLADILCSTASIWNLSIVGLDRYWAITSPVAYMAKRNKRTACIMIVSVWVTSALISLAPLLGWYGLLQFIAKVGHRNNNTDRSKIYRVWLFT
jgi:hypothetical protein